LSPKAPGKLLTTTSRWP